MQSTVLETAPRVHYATRRRHPRCLFTVPVTVHRSLPDGPAKTHGISLDISVGGMAVAVCSQPEVGETVDIEVCLPNLLCVARAIVRYNTRTQSGLEFVESAPALQRIVTSMDPEPIRDSVFVVR